MAGVSPRPRLPVGFEGFHYNIGRICGACSRLGLCLWLKKKKKCCKVIQNSGSCHCQKSWTDRIRKLRAENLCFGTCVSRIIKWYSSRCLKSLGDLFGLLIHSLCVLRLLCRGETPCLNTGVWSVSGLKYSSSPVDDGGVSECSWKLFLCHFLDSRSALSRWVWISPS